MLKFVCDCKSYVWWALIAIVLVFLQMNVVYALPQSSADMDGNPSDWLAGSTGGAAICFTDEDGVDDETTPVRADISEFCAHYNASGLYLLYAWDDTLPQGGGTAATVILDVNGDGNRDYVIGNSINGSPGSGLEEVGMEISTCNDAACSGTTLFCSERLTPGQCTGSATGFADTYPDPFSNPLRTGCGGTNCATQDAFVEMFIPWSLIGGSEPSTFLFATFRSAPSSTAASVEDNSSAAGNGIACGSTGCYSSTPTAVTLLGIRTSSGGITRASGLGAGVLLLLHAAAGVHLRKKRRTNRSG